MTANTFFTFLNCTLHVIKKSVQVLMEQITTTKTNNYLCSSPDWVIIGVSNVKMTINGLIYDTFIMTHNVAHILVALTKGYNLRYRIDKNSLWL